MSNKNKKVAAALEESRKARAKSFVANVFTDPSKIRQETPAELPEDGSESDDEPPVAKLKNTTVGSLPPLPKVKKPRKAKTPRSCECGCAAMTKGGRFVPGHDGRLHAWALRVERGVVKLKDVPDMHREAVKRHLTLTNREPKDGGR